MSYIYFFRKRKEQKDVDVSFAEFYVLDTDKNILYQMTDFCENFIDYEYKVSIDGNIFDYIKEFEDEYNVVFFNARTFFVSDDIDEFYMKMVADTVAKFIEVFKNKNEEMIRMAEKIFLVLCSWNKNTKYALSKNEENKPCRLISETVIDNEVYFVLRDESGMVDFIKSGKEHFLFKNNKGDWEELY